MWGSGCISPLSLVLITPAAIEGVSDGNDKRPTQTQGVGSDSCALQCTLWAVSQICMAQEMIEEALGFRQFVMILCSSETACVVDADLEL